MNYYYLVPDRIDDGSVAFHGSEDDSVGRRRQKSPERQSCEPDATDELVPGTAGRHTSAIHLDNSRQQREERRTHVDDALVDDENVNFLNNIRHSRQSSTMSIINRNTDLRA